MLKVGFFTLRPDKLTAFQSWMEELQRRSEEVLDTFRAEGTRHELVVVLEQTNPPIVVYAVEVEDFSRPRRSSISLSCQLISSTRQC